MAWTAGTPTTSTSQGVTTVTIPWSDGSGQVGTTTLTVSDGSVRLVWNGPALTSFVAWSDK